MQYVHLEGNPRSYPNLGERKPAFRDRYAALRSILTLCVAAALLWFAFRSVNLIAILQLLSNMGPLCGFVVLPSVLAIVTETWAWQQTFAAFTRAPSLLPLLRVRVITEAACALPLGPVWSEAVKPHLLAKHCGMDLAESLTGLAGRKYLLLLSQGLYLLLGVALGYQAFAHALATRGANPVLVIVAAAVSVLLITLAELLAGVLGGGTAAQRVLHHLSKVPLSRLRTTLLGFSERMKHVDGTAVLFFRAPWTKRWSLSLQYLTAWLLEASETWMILTLVGAQVDFSQALAVETVVVLVRHILFALPAGLGAQELGYAAFLGTLGVPVDQCAAFALLKRVKELLWVALGYLLFTADGAVRNAKPGIAPLTRPLLNPASE